MNAISLKKWMLSTFLGWLPSVLFLISCGKNKECNGISNQINLYFTLPVKTSPVKDTFNIGDTIWIEQEFSNSLKNSQNGKYYTLNNFDFNAGFSLIDLNKVGSIAITNPKIIVYEGSKSGESSTDISYKYENNTYKYKAAFITQQAGLYMLEFATTRSNGTGSITGVTQCKHEYYAFTFYNSNQGNCNYPFLKNSVDEFYQKRSEDAFNNAGSYAFYVK
ncbi:MAG: hypothetical protein J0L80_07505 [Chitinophagales bacterium]|nr:hypothetical protein [Chitinophagales bacterium]